MVGGGVGVESLGNSDEIFVESVKLGWEEGK